MDTTEEIVQKLEQIRLVPVVVLEEEEAAIPVAKALCEGGVPCAEVTFRTKAAKHVIQKMTQAYPDMLVGAGTVLTIEQAKEAITAGAKFIVSPGLNETVVSYCMEQKIPMIPGIATPSEVEKALSLGLSFVKFFPAEAAGGLSMLKSLSGPYPQLRFMPTGGITQANIKSYLDFKKIFACGGSFMITDEILKSKHYEKISEICKETLQIISKAVQKEEQIQEENNHKIKNKPDPSKKVVTLGEIMMRLQPFGYKRFSQANAYETVFGGSEANIALSLANMGVKTKFITKLPEHDIAEHCIQYLKQYDVETQNIVRGGERMGLYFIEKGAAQRPSKVIYDRTDSAMALAKAGEFSWEEIFADAGWFHFSGITAALSKESFEICLTACKEAKKRGIFVSCDFNYRKKFWSLKEAGAKLKELCPYMDAFWGITSREYLKEILDIEIDDSKFQANTSEMEKVAKTLVETYHFAFTVITDRKSISASENEFSAMLYIEEKAYFSKEYNIQIVDRVGAGDAFAAGLIYAMIKEMTHQETIEFATASAVLKHSVEGDCNLVTAEEVLLLSKGDGTGRVQR